MLAGLLAPAVRRAEDRVRRGFRPSIEAVLVSTGLQPRNLPERVAHSKLIEELLDRIVGRGFLTLGDLRDACSRSNLKLPDLAGPLEFVRGDRLLQTDRALAHALEGVYRRGEIYLRWLQRLSALAFGTPLGRFVTRLRGVAVWRSVYRLEGAGASDRAACRLDCPGRGPPEHGELRLGRDARHGGPRDDQLRGIPERVRRDCAVGGPSPAHAPRRLPARLLAIPLFRWLFASRAATIFWRFLLKPLIATLPVWLLGPRFGLDHRAVELSAAGVFLLATVLFNSRLGRDVEEILADEAVRAWRQFWLDIVPGLFRLVLQTFDRILEAVERLLYAVDEWLRFRSGQSAADRWPARRYSGSSGFSSRTWCGSMSTC